MNGGWCPSEGVMAWAYDSVNNEWSSPLRCRRTRKQGENGCGVRVKRGHAVTSVIIRRDVTHVAPLALGLVASLWADHPLRPFPPVPSSQLYTVLSWSWSHLSSACTANPSNSHRTVRTLKLSPPCSLVELPGAHRWKMKITTKLQLSKNI